MYTIQRHEYTDRRFSQRMRGMIETKRITWRVLRDGELRQSCQTRKAALRAVAMWQRLDSIG